MLSLLIYICVETSSKLRLGGLNDAINVAARKIRSADVDKERIGCCRYDRRPVLGDIRLGTKVVLAEVEAGVFPSDDAARGSACPGAVGRRRGAWQVVEFPSGRRWEHSWFGVHFCPRHDVTRRRLIGALRETSVGARVRMPVITS